MKRIAIILLVLGALFLFYGVALAKGDYVSSFQQAYPGAKGSKLDGCNLCHGSGFALNNYAKDWAAANKDYKAIEGKDSDGDGATNLAEINAKTYPGDASDKPAAAPPTGGTGSGGGTTGGGTTPPAPPKPPAPPVDKSKLFWDLDNHWAKDAGQKANLLGLMKGYPDNSFGVDNDVTRAEFGAITLRAFRLSENLPEKSPYRDVATSDWYYGVVNAIAANNIIAAYSDGNFKPNAPMDRETAAEALIRGMGLATRATSMLPEEINAALAPFADKGSISSDRAPFLGYAVKLGLFTGADGKILPKKSITRGETATLMVRLFTLDIPEANVNAYVTSAACKTCHPGDYADWQGTLHSKMVQDAKKPGAIIGDFSTNTKFTVADVVYTVGVSTGQRYVGRTSTGDLVYLPLAWNPEKRVWTDNKPSSWLAGCAKCHTTGFNPATKTWSELGIACEACHGPGGKHVIAGGDKTKIRVSNDFATCDQCHGQGEQVKQTKHAVAFAELSKLPYYGQGCIKCHSATVIVATANGKTPPTWADFKTGALKNDRVSITCVVCHDPHKNANEAQLRESKEEACTVCHTSDLTADKYTAGKEVHHPSKEVWEGKGAIGIPDMPSKKKVTCVDCHMTDGNHLFKVGTPTLTLTSHGKPYEANSCAKCHATDKNVMAAEIKERQEKVEAKVADYSAKLAAFKAKIDAAKTAGSDVTAAQDAYNIAFTNLSIIEADASKGMHNPWFIDAILDSVAGKITTLTTLLP